MAEYSEYLDVLFEDNHLLVINKPAGWPTAHASNAEETMDQLARCYLKEKYHKTGNVFLGIVHRLDKPVSGVLIFARTSKAASRLSLQFREHAVEKIYWAITTSNPRWKGNRWGTFQDYLYKNERKKQIEIARENDPEALLCVTHYECQVMTERHAFWELRPQTGRKHQLRVQLASRGMPIEGDEKYGSPHLFGHSIALHAHSMTLLHPIRNEPITFRAALPIGWRSKFAALLSMKG